MRRWTSAFVVILLAASVGNAQADAAPRRAKLIDRCEQVFGKSSLSLGPTHPLFRFDQRFFVSAELSDSGALAEIAIQPWWFAMNRNPTDAERRWGLSDAKAASFLKKANALRPLGKLLTSAWVTSNGSLAFVEEYERATVTRVRDVQGNNTRKGPLQEITVRYK